MRNSKQVSLTTLHKRTGAVIREVAKEGVPVIVTDRGRPVAAIERLEDFRELRRFRDRVLLPAFRRLQDRRTAGDSAIGISVDRDRY